MASEGRMAFMKEEWAVGEMTDQQLKERMATYPPEKLDMMKDSMPQSDIRSVGDVTPDGEVFTLVGESKRLSVLIAKRGPTVINFGSYT